VAFDAQPTLAGTLVSMRPLRPDDEDALFGVACDPFIWEQHPVRDRYKPEVFARFFRESLESGGALIILDARDGRVIGSSRFDRYDPQASEVEIGWTFLARSYWGGVYNGEVKRLMIAHALRTVRRVVFLVGPQNVRSQRAIEKLGAERVGLRRDAAGRHSYLYEISVVPPAPERAAAAR
jgi:RimJ/RimL family protein N-acetyltransferase